MEIEGNKINFDPSSTNIGEEIEIESQSESQKRRSSVGPCFFDDWSTPGEKISINVVRSRRLSLPVMAPFHNRLSRRDKASRNSTPGTSGKQSSKGDKKSERKINREEVRPQSHKLQKHRPRPERDIILLQKPKRPDNPPSTGFSIFRNELQRREKQRTGSAPTKGEIFKMAMMEWTALPEEAQERYNDQARKGMTNFSKEYARYTELKMIYNSQKEMQREERRTKKAINAVLDMEIGEIQDRFARSFTLKENSDNGANEVVME